MSTSESAAELLARNIAFFERRTAPRRRAPLLWPQPGNSVPIVPGIASKP
jgi:hypothetical protein